MALPDALIWVRGQGGGLGRYGLGSHIHDGFRGGRLVQNFTNRGNASHLPLAGRRAFPVLDDELTLGWAALARAYAACVCSGEPVSLKCSCPRGCGCLIAETAAGNHPVAGQDAVARGGPPVLAVESGLMEPLGLCLGMLLVVRAQDGGSPEYSGGRGGCDGRRTGLGGRSQR